MKDEKVLKHPKKPL